jgi:hypothetical protein
MYFVEDKPSYARRWELSANVDLSGWREKTIRRRCELIVAFEADERSLTEGVVWG